MASPAYTTPNEIHAIPYNRAGMRYGAKLPASSIAPRQRPAHHQAIRSRPNTILCWMRSRSI